MNKTLLKCYLKYNVGEISEEFLENSLNYYNNEKELQANEDYSTINQLRLMKAKDTYKNIFNEYAKLFNKSTDNSNFGRYIENTIKFLKYDYNALNQYCSIDDNIVKMIINGKRNPWDISIEKMIKLSELLGIDLTDLIIRIKNHPVSVENKTQNTIGLCARADSNMSSKARKEALENALTRTLLINEEKKKNEYINNLEELRKHFISY